MYLSLFSKNIVIYFFPDRCYLFDSKAFLVMDPDFLIASALDESKYEQVQLGTKEGEVMKDLIYKHDFFDRVESIDFQGSCRITPEEPKVSRYYDHKCFLNALKWNILNIS